MKHGTPKKLLALALAMTVILSLGLTSAFADDPEVGSVSIKPEDEGMSVSAENATVTEDPDGSGNITIEAGEPEQVVTTAEEVVVTVEGGINVTTGTALKIKGNGSQEGSTEIAVISDVTLANENGGGTGAEVENITASIKGNISAKGKTPEGEIDADVYGVRADNSILEVTGNITSESENGSYSYVEGVQATNSTVIITGDITAKDTNTEGNYSPHTYGVNDKDKSNVTVYGNVEATSTVSKNDKTIGIVMANDGSSVQILDKNSKDDITGGGINENAGNVSSSEVGVKIDEGYRLMSTSGEGSGDGENTEVNKTEVTIQGTLNVDEGGTPILIGQGVTADNVEITVWKVEVKGEQAEEGEIVKSSAAGKNQEGHALLSRFSAK